MKSIEKLGKLQLGRGSDDTCAVAPEWRAMPSTWIAVVVVCRVQTKDFEPPLKILKHREGGTTAGANTAPL